MQQLQAFRCGPVVPCSNGRSVYPHIGLPTDCGMRQSRRPRLRHMMTSKIGGRGETAAKAEIWGAGSELVAPEAFLVREAAAIAICLIACAMAEAAALMRGHTIQAHTSTVGTSSSLSCQLVLILSHAHTLAS